MLSCHSFREIVERSVEDRSSLPSEVRVHLETCQDAECQEVLLEYDLLEAAIREWKQTVPRIDLKSALLSEIEHLAGDTESVTTVQAQKQTRGSSSLVLGLVTATLSLCLLLMVLAVASNPSVDRGRVAMQDHQSSPVTNVVSETDRAEDEDVVAELRELGKAYGGWVQGATHRLTDTVAVVLVEEKTPQTKTSRNWFPSITESIEPIESQFGKTIDLLLKHIPSESDEQSRFFLDDQKEYLGFLWSKSASVKLLFS